MELAGKFSEVEGLQRDLLFIGLSILLVAGVAGAHNLATLDNPEKISPVKIDSECAGIDIGFCLGVQRYEHTTVNYDNYTVPEEGTEEFYDRVESQLMIQAYETCDEDTDGMEWTSEVSYMNQTAEEWQENEEVELWSCEKTFYRDSFE